MDFFEAYVETLRRMLENMFIQFSPEYLAASTRLSWIAGIAMAVMIIVAVIVSRRNVALGIATAVFQVGGAVGIQKFVHVFMQMDLTHVEHIVGSSQAEVDQLIAEYQRSVIERVTPGFVGMMLYFIAWVLLLVFIIKCMRFSPKVFGVFALIVQIVRYVAIAPFNPIALVTATMTEAVQQRQDYLVHGAALLAVFLIFIPCLVSGIFKRKES